MPENTLRGKKCGSKRHSLQAVELSQRLQMCKLAVQIVLKPSALRNGGPISRF